MNYTFRSALFVLPVFLFILLLSSGCKKEHKSVTEWETLAKASLEKINDLSSNIPCAQSDEVEIKTIQMGCTPRYFTVTSDIEAEFNSLVEDYQYYSGKVMEARVDEGIVIEPCPDGILLNHQFLKLGCADGKVLMITTENLPLEEAQEYIDNAYAKIQTYRDTLSCRSPEALAYTGLLKKETSDFEFDYLIYARGDATDEIGEMIMQYNALRLRQIEAGEDPQYVNNEQDIEGIDCIDGKPSLRLRD